jgi:hypothetical protein
MSSIEDMIDQIGAKDFNSANDEFESLIRSKIQDAMEQQKIAVAGKIWNGDEEQLELELDDEDLAELDAAEAEAEEYDDEDDEN